MERNKKTRNKKSHTHHFEIDELRLWLLGIARINDQAELVASVDFREAYSGTDVPVVPDCELLLKVGDEFTISRSPE